MIEICTVGGYNEVGKNCTAIKVDDEVFIIDMGIHLESYIKYTEEEDVHNISAKQLVKVGAIPDISLIDDWKDKVKAIIPTHAHLDHIGAIPYLAKKFKSAPIITTPFSISVIKTILKDERMKLKNPLKKLNPNDTIKLTDKVTLEFIYITHSVPQAVMVALHTPEGIILYANDFKFDSTPTLGQKPNFKRLKELGKKNIVALIVDSTYADLKVKTFSESVAKEKLREVLLGTENTGKTVIVSTFSSHIARLKSIVEFGRKMKRKIIFLGRSLWKYTTAAKDLNLVGFKDVELVKYGNQIEKKLKKVAQDPSKYLIVATGHQGEPKAALSRMSRDEFPLKLKKEDHVVFSCRVIPTKINEANREKLEENLEKKDVRIFRDVHVSGHAAREDLRDLINIVKPKNIIPAHGKIEMTSALANLAEEMGYDSNNIFVSLDGKRIKL